MKALYLEFLQKKIAVLEKTFWWYPEMKHV